MLKWNVFSFSAILIAVFAFGDGADKSKFIPPKVGTPEEFRFTLNQPLGKNVKLNFMKHLEQYSKSPKADLSKFQWGNNGQRSGGVEIHENENKESGFDFKTSWRTINAKIFFVTGQSVELNSALYMSYLQYIGCIHAAKFKIEVAYCAEAHPIIELSKICPDKDTNWLAEQRRVLAEFSADVNGETTGAVRITALPKTMTDFHNKYAIQDSRTDNSKLYMKRLYEYRVYIADPMACHIAMTTWAEAGTQVRVFRQGYNFSESDYKVVNFYSNPAAVETAVAPAEYAIPKDNGPINY